MRKIIAKQRCLSVIKIRKLGLIALELVGKDQDLRSVGSFPRKGQAIPFFEFLFTGHTQTLSGDFFQITFLRHKERNGIVQCLLLFFLDLCLLCLVNDLGLTRLTVLFGDLLQLRNDHILQAALAVQGIPQVCDLLFQLIDGLCLSQNILFIDVTQFDFCHIVRLDLINTKADHQIGDNFTFQLGFTDDFDRLIDIQQDTLQTFQ